MVDLQELFWGFFAIQGVEKVDCMALTFKSPPASRCSSSPQISWVDLFFIEVVPASLFQGMMMKNILQIKLARTVNQEESIKPENDKGLHVKQLVEENEQYLASLNYKGWRYY